MKIGDCFKHVKCGEFNTCVTFIKINDVQGDLCTYEFIEISYKDLQNDFPVIFQYKYDTYRVLNLENHSKITLDEYENIRNLGQKYENQYDILIEQCKNDLLSKLC